MKVKEKISNRIIDKRRSILQALKKMDSEGVKLLFVYDNDAFKGILTIGDIQRAILSKIDLSAPLLNILDTKKIYAKPGDPIQTIKSLMLSFRAECMPVVNENDVLIDVHFWDDILYKTHSHCIIPFNLPIVIMAGGEGKRLKPLTNVLPKPLIPIGEKTIIEDIMDRFVSCGSKTFYISINYKADFIRSYFSQLNNKDYIINYIQENRPLGTAGSLAFLNKEIHTTFFVSNCDIVIEEDYDKILQYHIENKNEITIVTALKYFSLPYGIVETTEEGLLSILTEKPELLYKINTGMYILESNLLKEIPKNTYHNITDLINNVIKRDGRVGCFPVSEKAWKDIGEWSEYLRLIHK